MKRYERTNERIQVQSNWPACSSLERWIPIYNQVEPGTRSILRGYELVLANVYDGFDYPDALLITQGPAQYSRGLLLLFFLLGHIWSSLYIMEIHCRIPTDTYIYLFIFLYFYISIYLPYLP
ncbi:uncharacterized protein F4812DRAFT_205257 [Daldinia caldariorum]|uniref:uncharacterized protein n=1 Tax=Daldinia caldariorum TaxID=326644 RepID=UPI002008CEC3|nr:uncharacterized protein F4812DRAFT_205257 [Daldinia caldariorum]KAI1472111.1 hypothetical protein F4812DRAFT_205257 [Daldinia caldariorum]